MAGGTSVDIPAVFSDSSGVSWRTGVSGGGGITAATSSQTHSRNLPTPTNIIRGSDTAISTTEQELVVKVQAAVSTIETWWWSTKNRRIFKILKEAVRSAERSFTNDVIRKVCPSEAELLKDPTMRARIKFRFGGERFPPIVLFKMFISSGGGSGVQYLSGKKMIRPSSEAARDAHRTMGSRVFYDQMLVDACHHQQMRITDEMDVTTMKEYMQYVSTVDETPAYLGGKDNTWRKLNHQALPRHSMIHGVLEVLESTKEVHPSAGGGGGGGEWLSLQKLQRFTRPPTQLEQIQRIKTISSLREGRGGCERRTSHGGSRGSRIARHRARKMRETYSSRSPSTAPHHSQSEGREGESEEEAEGEEEEEGDSDMDREASELYEWTQNLSFDDTQ